MSTLVYRNSYTLPWSESANDKSRFRVILVVALLVALLFGGIMPLIDLPEKERFKRQTLPPRLAQLILEQKRKPPPPPKPKQVKIPKKKKPAEVKKPKVAKKKPKPKKQPPKQVAKKQPKPKPAADAARKKAASSGLLAFADELADLREAPEIAQVQTARNLTKSGSKAKVSQRSMITSGTASQGSSGINTAKLSRNTGGGALADRRTTKVKNSVANEVAKQTRKSGKGKNHKANRTREEIQLVFDQNKGAVYALYNRALRKDPSLQGKVVLELTIAPSGKVTACKILSSELNDKRLERKLISRVKMFKFPSKDVDVAIVSYPIDFLPS
jgi:TonB family protein